MNEHPYSPTFPAVEAVGPRFSRAAAERAAWSAAALRGLLAETGLSDRLAALHARRYPDAYAPGPFDAMHGPVRPTSALVPSVEPNGHGMTANDRACWDLEAQADAILRAAGEDVHRVDIRDPRTYQMTVAPDRVAYRGAPTTQLPESADEARAVSTRGRRVAVRSAVSGKRKRYSWQYAPTAPFGPVVTWRDMTAVSRPDMTEDETYAAVMLGHFEPMRVTELETIQLRGRGQCWHILGHGLAILAPDRIATRKARRARKAVAAGRTAHRAGRPAANPLSADARTIRRRWATASAEQRAAADRIVAVLLTTVPGTVIGTGATAVTVADDCSSASIGRGPLESVHAVARRLALAGTMLAD